MAATCVGILSPGDMGHAVGAFLAGRGFRVITALAGRSELTRARAGRAGIEDAEEELIEIVDFLKNITRSPRDIVVCRDFDPGTRCMFPVDPETP